MQAPPTWLTCTVGGFYLAGPASIEAADQICRPRLELCGSIARLPDDSQQREPQDPRTTWLTATAGSTVSGVSGTWYFETYDKNGLRPKYQPRMVPFAEIKVLIDRSIKAGEMPRFIAPQDVRRSDLAEIEKRIAPLRLASTL